MTPRLDADLPRLTVLGPMSDELARGLADGMALTRRWQVDIHALHARHLVELDRDPPTAVLLYGGSDRAFDLVARFQGPVLNYSSMLTTSPVPRVAWDNLATGRLAADHLLERGFRHFACCGYTAAQFSLEREQGFRAALAQVGLEPSCHLIAGRPRPQAFDPGRLGRWLAEQTRPLALFAVNDEIADLVCTAALRLGWHVPEDLAILGADDSARAVMSAVPLSSLQTPHLAMGRSCLRLLEDLLAGRPVAAETLHPSPGISLRQSTDLQAVDDPRVARALAWIRAHLHEPIGVSDVAAAQHLGRRTLELACQRCLGRTPRQLIESLRLQLACDLLRRPEQKIDAIAKRCGFRDRHRFSAVFIRHKGVGPATWRQRQDC